MDKTLRIQTTQGNLLLLNKIPPKITLHQLQQMQLLQIRLLNQQQIQIQLLKH